MRASQSLRFSRRMRRQRETLPRVFLNDSPVQALARELIRLGSSDAAIMVLAPGQFDKAALGRMRAEMNYQGSTKALRVGWSHQEDAARRLQKKS